MEVWVVQAKHVFDDDYEIIGIYKDEIEAFMAKRSYLNYKENTGLSRTAFTFKEEKYEVGKMYY